MLYVLLSILSGLTIVISITFNSKMSEYKSLSVTSFYNYVFGIIPLGLIVLFSSGLVPLDLNFNEWFMYIGGSLAVFIVIGSSHVTTKIGIFYATLFILLGQLISANAIDYVRNGKVDVTTIMGCILIVAGLIYEGYMEKKGA